MPSAATSKPSARVAGLARWAVLLLTLTLCCATGLYTPYALAVIGSITGLVLIVRGRLPSMLAPLGARLFVGVFAVLAVCFALAARQPHDLLYAFNFLMLALFPALFALLGCGARSGNAGRVALLALLGSALALLVVAYNLVVGHNPRGESTMLGAILLANTAILLGFLSLLGVLAGHARARWVYLLGPLLGVVTALLTGSRGPLLAVVPLALISLVFILRNAGISRRVILVHGLLGLLALVLLVVLIQGRGVTLFGIVADLLAGHSVTDSSTDIRIALYRAGWSAFLDSPWYGHGWANMMQAVRPYLPVDETDYANFPQLHDDLLNFAVAAGIVGVGCYLLLLKSPLIAALASRRDSQYQVRLFGAALLGTAYFFDGITDLMIGFEFHTALFASIAAILLGYCRDAPEGALADAPRPPA